MVPRPSLPIEGPALKLGMAVAVQDMSERVYGKQKGTFFVVLFLGARLPKEESVCQLYSSDPSSPVD